MAQFICFNAISSPDGFKMPITDYTFMIFN